MAIDVTLLKTRAECDQVTSALADRITTLTKRQTDLTYSAATATERAQGYSDELTDLVADIAADDAAIPTLTAGSERRLAREDRRRKTNDRREEVLALQRELGGAAAVLRQSELKETEGRIASIEADVALVAAHKPTLSA